MFDKKESAGKVTWRRGLPMKHTSGLCLNRVVRIRGRWTRSRHGRGFVDPVHILMDLDGPGPRTLLDLSLFCTPIYFRLAQQCAMRWSNNITRRVYNVGGPNSLWHMVELYCLVS